MDQAALERTKVIVRWVHFSLMLLAVVIVALMMLLTAGLENSTGIDSITATDRVLKFLAWAIALQVMVLVLALVRLFAFKEFHPFLLLHGIAAFIASILGFLMLGTVNKARSILRHFYDPSFVQQLVNNYSESEDLTKPDFDRIIMHSIFFVVVLIVAAVFCVIAEFVRLGQLKAIATGGYKAGDANTVHSLGDSFRAVWASTLKIIKKPLSIIILSVSALLAVGAVVLFIWVSNIKTDYDPFAGVKFSFSGESGSASLVIDKFPKAPDIKDEEQAKSFLETVVFESEADGSIANGQSVKVQVHYSKELAEKLKINVTRTSKTFKAKGLYERYLTLESTPKQLLDFVDQLMLDGVVTQETVLEDQESSYRQNDAATPPEVFKKYFVEYGKNSDSYGKSKIVYIFRSLWTAQEKRSSYSSDHSPLEQFESWQYYSVTFNDVNSDYAQVKRLEPSHINGWGDDMTEQEAIEYVKSDADKYTEYVEIP